MATTSPLSPYLSLLVLLLPGLWWAGVYFSRAVTYELGLAKLLTPGFTVLLWLLSVHVSGLLSHDFNQALVLGTLLPGLLGYALRLRLGAADAEPAFPWPLARQAALATLVILPATLFWDFNDKILEDFYYGHFAITEQILNGVYPPRDLTFPEINLVYHYGVDTLFAMLIAISRLRTDWVIDLATLLTWWYTLFLFGALSARLFGERAAWLGIWIGGFAGGLPWLAGWFNEALQVDMRLVSFSPNLMTQLMGLYTFAPSAEVGASGSGGRVNMWFASWFFAHPWSLGLPLALLPVLLWSQKQQRKTWFWALLLCLLVASFVHLAVFLTLGAALLATLLLEAAYLHRQGQRSPELLLAAGGLLLALLLSPLLSDMVSSLLVRGSTAEEWGGVAFSPYGIAGNWANNLTWHVATFGLFLPLGLLGFLLLPRRFLWLFGLLVIGSLLSLNLFRYERTGDIVKFAIIAQLALSVAATGAIAWLWRRGRGWLRLGTWMLVAILILPGLLYHLPFWLYPNLPDSRYLNDGHLIVLTPPALWRENQMRTLVAPSGDERTAIAALRPLLQPGEGVLCPPEDDVMDAEPALACALLGGFPQLWGTGWAYTFGYPASWIERRRALIEAPQLASQTYWQAGFRWALIPADYPSRWTALARLWEQTGQAQLLNQFGTVKLYRLTDSAAPLSESEMGYRLGRIMLHGDAVPAQPTLGRQWLARAARQGNSAAIEELGNYYAQNAALRAHQRFAAYWFLQLAQQGNPIRLEQLAQRGNAEAQWLLGQWLQGQTPPQPALNWYRRAATQGHIGALNQLSGLVSADGALERLREAAESGGLVAQRQLAAQLSQQQTETKSLCEAVKLYQRLILQGMPETKTNLIKLWQRHQQQLQQTCPRALLFPLFQAAERGDTAVTRQIIQLAEKGQGLAQFVLANWLAQGKAGLKQQTAQARHWYQQAAAQGIAKAQYELGKMAYQEKNYPQAEQELRAAALRGFAQAALWLGRLHLHTLDEGFGDPAQAEFWLRQAEVRGIDQARDDLTQLERW